MFPFVAGKFLHFVVKTGHGDAAFFVAQRRQHLAERHRRVLHAAAINARMQIGLGPAHGDFHRRHAAQGVRERGMFFGRHSGIRHHHGIAFQLALFLAEKFHQTFAAHFFLPFDHKSEVARQLGAGFQKCLHRFEVREMLAFIIRGPARVHRAIANRGLKRRRVPFVQRLRRLHVVMAVHQKMRALAWPFRSGGGDDGMKIRGVLARFEPDGAAVIHHPISRGAHILGVLALGGNAGQAKVFAQLLFKASAMGLEEIKNRLHSRGV